VLAMAAQVVVPAAASLPSPVIITLPPGFRIQSQNARLEQKPQPFDAAATPAVLATPPLGALEGFTNGADN
jgi:hypothetical protein